ncbi:pitrilysin family protein [Puia sp.]|jgi:predicted Zn-dependent peptidase|uniref:M16 family metallopeptidase n=1 Tax=Puia sp. TaxID=2045100 RepID=UPI002F3E831D
MSVKTKSALDRTIAPPIKDAIEFDLSLPPYSRHVLSNGVEVYAIDLGSVDAMMVSWIFNGGNSFEKKKGVASAVSSLLKNGTSTRSAFDINEHFEYYGAWLNRASHHETSDITLHCLNKHIGQLLPVVAELISDSVFPQDELDIYKKNAQQRLQVSLKKSEFVAGRLIDAYLFGSEHPYGRYLEQGDYQQLEREDLTAFYHQHYREGACRIMVAGKLPADILTRLEAAFGGLPLHAPQKEVAFPAPSIIPAPQKKYNIVNDANGVQGSIRIARNFPNRHHPDFQRVQVLNNVFGGFFGSRLMANIREEKGYTYGIYSYLVNNIQESALVISTEAGKEVCAPTIAEVYKEMDLLREELIDEEELQMARNFAIGTILGDLDGPFHVASRWKNILLNGLDGQYFEEGVRIIKTIGPEELRELARKYLRPEDFFELVVV